MTYYLTTHHELDGWDIEADWSYSVDPGHPETGPSYWSGGEPAEEPCVEDLSLDAMRLEGKSVEPPTWLEEWLQPSPDTLIAHASERLTCERDEAADYQRDMRMDAA